LNFLERSLTFDAFIGGLDNGFRPGVLVFNTLCDERATWAIGYFKNNNSPFGWNVGDGEGDVTGRLTYLPWYSEDGRCLLHVGIGASHRDLDDNQARFRARTLLRNGPGVSHTVLAEARMLGDNQDLIVPELALVWGPLTVQAEYFATWVHDAAAPIAAPVEAGTAFFSGYYVEALYFLTGENRDYDKKLPRFSRVVPNENFFYVQGDEGPICGRGGWQVGARYSVIDLSDSGINGGDVEDLTVGLNWFFNPSLKLQWNYSIAWRDAAGNTSDGTVQGFGMRVAYDF
jgi:phosphate-selective porin OprO/OprP